MSEQPWTIDGDVPCFYGTPITGRQWSLSAEHLLALVRLAEREERERSRDGFYSLLERYWLRAENDQERVLLAHLRRELGIERWRVSGEPGKGEG
jgi:hypothetical protein